MRIVIDIDGTICEIKKPGQTYADVRLNKGAGEKIKALKAAGHYIILHTSRHMKTTGGNVGQVVAKVGKQTVDWLHKHGIVYDEIYFGKPYADVSIDDQGFRFQSWEKIEPSNFNNEHVNIVIPMAGLGRRFLDAGYKAPKPLISALGKTLVEWAMSSLDFLPRLPSYTLTFIVLAQHVRENNLDKELKKFFGPSINVISLPEPTRGQAETVLAARNIINNFNKLFIYNCDTYSISTVWDVIQAEDPDGALTCFESTDARYSFVKNDQFGYVEAVTEKKVISGWASTGLYYFKRGTDFVSAASAMVLDNELTNNEFYVIPCYQSLLNRGQKVKAMLADSNWVLGTPEELEFFKKNYQ